MLSEKQLSSYVQFQQNDQQNYRSGKLNLSHKQLRKIPQICLDSLHITKVDLSYNFIKGLNQIKIIQLNSPPPQNNENQKQQKCTLKWLDLSFNIIQNIDLKTQKNSRIFYQLQYLNASVNRLEAVNINSQYYQNLQHLHLKNNKIKFFINCPRQLKILSLDKNMLTQLAFIGGDQLQILSAGHNKIQKIAIKTPELVFLNVQSNQIFKMDTFYPYLQSIKNILSLNLIDNPISSNKQYKVIVLSTCPKIVQINQIYINPHVRQGFRILKQQQKLEEVLERTTQNYKKKLQAQLEFKQKMLEKLKLQEKQIQEKFLSYCQIEKQQMQMLQNFAKNTLGQQKFKVAQEKDQFMSKVQNSQPERKNKNIFGQNNENKSFNIKREQYDHKKSYEQFKSQIKAKYKKQSYDSAISQKDSEQQGDENRIQQENRNKRKNNQKNKIDEKNKNQKEKEKNPNQYNTNKKYRNSRNSIMNKPQLQNIKVQGQQTKIQKIKGPIESYKSISNQNIQNKEPKTDQQTLDLKLDQVLDLRCIKYLEKYYSFY